MVSTGQVPFKSIRKMLDECAPGHKIKVKKHKTWVYFGKKKAFLPKGPHGAKRSYSLEIGHIRNMVRQFEIEKCAKEQLPQL